MAEFSPPLWMTLFTPNGMVAPVTASTAERPRPGLVEPLVEVNDPPMTSLPPSGETTRARTPQPPCRSTVKGSRAPVEALTAATFVRVAPPTLVNSPPM
jgi:hypothetical protein